MAKHIRIGDPVNEAERWAFDYLAEHLPDAYWVITNLEVLAQSGQPLEVDALVIGEFAVYLVDVKGYVGHLEAGVNDWSLDGKWVSNSLSKANYVARVLAGRIGARMPRGIRAPWCQGMVLATGQEGRHIEITRDASELCAFTPTEILPALTDAEYLTSRYKDALTRQQRDYSLEVIGNVSVMAARQNHIQDFEKIKLLGKTSGVEIWEAKYSVGDWDSDWLLKVVEAARAESPEQYAVQTATIREEFYRLQQLSGISGVPTSAPLINDGEQLVLPIKRPRGIPLSIFESTELVEEDSIQFLRRAVVSMQQIHARGCTVGSVTKNNVFVSNEGDLEFLDIRNDLDKEHDIANFRKLFTGLAATIQSATVKDWFEHDGEGDSSQLEVLRHLLSSELVGDSAADEQEFEIAPGSIIADRYRLDSRICDIENGEFWKARHIAGQFICAVSIYNQAIEFWPYIGEQFSRLIHIYHPSLERVFDFGVIEAANVYYISRAWADGEPLRLTGKSADTDKLTGWMKCLLIALQYLHSQELIHRNITPDNIICSGNGAVLVNYSGIPAELQIAEDMRYSDPSLGDTGWTHESDIYSLIVSFLSLSPNADNTTFSTLTPEMQEWLESVFGASCNDAIQRFLTHRETIEPGTNYLSYFGLEEVNSRIEDLPEEFKIKWGISKGYMTFLVLDMINDQNPRSRNQWVLHALRSRQIPGNKTNRGSMNATVSRLKSAAIAEDYGKKVRLTKDFVESLPDFL